ARRVSVRAVGGDAGEQRAVDRMGDHESTETTMLNCRPRLSTLLAVLSFLLLTGQALGRQDKTDPLPSWTDGRTKQSILEFVRVTTDKADPKYVPPAERIATFDNDGTLWCEQPLPVQLYFALDRVKALAPQHPEW